MGNVQQCFVPQKLRDRKIAVQQQQLQQQKAEDIVDHRRSDAEEDGRMQKVPPRKPKHLQPGVPKLKMAPEFASDPTGNNNQNDKLKSRVNVTTSSQYVPTNSQSSLTTSRKTSVSSSSSQVYVVKSNLNELKNNISEMKSIDFNNIKKSLEDLVDADDDPQPKITFPDDTPVPSEIGSPTNTMDTIKFEQKTMNNIRTSKMVKDGLCAKKASANFEESKRMETGDVSYEENSQAKASHAKLEVDGISTEKSRIKATEARSLITPDKVQQEMKNMDHTSVKVKCPTFSAGNSATEAQQERQMVTSTGLYNTSKHTSSSQSNFTYKKGIHTSTSSMLQTNSQFQLNGNDELVNMSLTDLECLTSTSSREEVDITINKYTKCLAKFISCLRQKDLGAKSSLYLNKINDIMHKAWAVPTHGHDLGNALCDALRDGGGLDLLMDNCNKDDKDLRFSTASVLEQCLTSENRAYVVKNGLDKVVKVACFCTNNNTVGHSRVGTGIFEHLFKHSEETCSDVVRYGGLDALLFECRKSDVVTLRHCAGALANLSLYGGTENQEAMIKNKVPMWLFPLAFHTDDNIKYYACLAITVLVANAEIESDVLQSGTLELVEPFVTSHNPSDFAKSNSAHAHGQSETWLRHLVPVLKSKREEARNLAAFHFCMEAGIKQQQGNTKIFNEIGAVESLKTVASCPNAVASKYAAKALRLIGEEVPHKLSQQVPLWSVEDVVEWIKQIGFTEHASSFNDSRVDGDLLFKLTEENLKDDIGLANGIKRKRFFRELEKLKRMADYSSRDAANINHFLQSLGPEFSIYTYSMLNAGVETKDSLRGLSEDQLSQECHIKNSIHRARIMEGIRQFDKTILSNMKDDNIDKSLDVFVSYRRSNGSQLASLLKVHLQLRGFSVFIDVERLEAGKFDNNLLQSIQKAKHFLLVLTPDALERCIGDSEKKDWVHREIVAALSAQCNIIPIVDNFAFPDVERLPEDMRQVCHFNAVKWIHDYQDACVDKVERFMRGENKIDGVSTRAGATPGTPSSALPRQPPSYQRMHSNDSGSGKGSDKDVNGNSGLRD